MTLVNGPISGANAQTQVFDGQIHLRGTEQDCRFVTSPAYVLGKVTLVAVGGKYYQSVTAPGAKPWLQLNPKYGIENQAMVGPEIGYLPLPDRLAALGTLPTMQIGADTEIQGTHVREYRFTLGPQLLAQQERDWRDHPAGHSAQLQGYGGATGTVTVFVGTDGLPHRLVIEAREPLVNTIQAETTDFSGWGTTPAIVAPPAAQVNLQR